MARPLTEEGDGAPSLRPLYMLLPYLWPKGYWGLKARVVVSLVCMVFAKVATVLVPYLFGRIVDLLNGPMKMLAAGLALIAVYTLARILMQAFAQLRDGIFAKVAYHALRQVGVSTFAHVHTLSLRFHLERKTGGLSRVIDRGTKGIDTLLGFALFSIFPTILELAFVTGVMLWKFDVWFALTTVVMVVAYIWFTFAITRWRIQFRRIMNESDTEASTKAVDSLLNYETVKYFNNEQHETRRFDKSMEKYAKASIQTQISLSVLNTGQAIIVALGLAAIMALAAVGVVRGHLTVGDLVMANSYLIQLYVPLNLLGTVYREITQALVDMDAMFRLLHQPQEVTDKPGAKALKVTGGEIRFDNVVFSYDPERIVLKGVSFVVPAGKTIAVVGPSGAGKSTISRILYRFYDIRSGSVTIDGQDIRDVTQESLRAVIGIVPQDTVLFNDTVRYNIAYGRIGASEVEIKEAAGHAQIDKFIRDLPLGYEFDGRRARAETLGWREATCCHCAHDFEESAHPLARRSDFGAGHPYRTRNPERFTGSFQEPYHARYRASPFDRYRRRRNPGARSWRDRGTGTARRFAPTPRGLRLDVEQAARSCCGPREAQGSGERPGCYSGHRPRPAARGRLIILRVGHPAAVCLFRSFAATIATEIQTPNRWRRRSRPSTKENRGWSL